MSWLIVFLAIAALGAVVTWLSGRRLATAVRGLVAQTSDSLDRLSRRSAFLETLGAPSDTYRRTRDRGANLGTLPDRGRDQ